MSRCAVKTKAVAYRLMSVKERTGKSVCESQQVNVGQTTLCNSICDARKKKCRCRPELGLEREISTAKQNIDVVLTLHTVL